MPKVTNIFVAKKNFATGDLRKLSGPSPFTLARRPACAAQGYFGGVGSATARRHGGCWKGDGLEGNTAKLKRVKAE